MGFATGGRAGKSIVQPVVQRAHGGGVALEDPLRKCIHLILLEFHCSVPGVLAGEVGYWLGRSFCSVGFGGRTWPPHSHRTTILIRTPIEMKTLHILWQRLVTPDRETCERCGGTQDAIVRAIPEQPVVKAALLAASRQAGESRPSAEREVAVIHHIARKAMLA